MTGPALSDGVPGLEALHTMTPPAPYSSFTLNDWMDPATGKTRTWENQSAWSLLSKITGIHDKPDADDPRVSLNYQQGELPLPRYGRGRTITYSGMVAGQTLSAMRGKIAALRAAADNALTNPTAWFLSVAYDSTYDDTGLVFVGYGIPTGFTCDDEQGAPTLLPSPFQREFDLSFRQSEGRWWVTSDPQSIGWDGDTYTPIDGGTSGTLDMPGTAPSEPTFTLISEGDGDATLIFSGTEAGGILQIDLPSAMNSADKIVVNFGQRTVMYTPSGGSPHDYSGFINWDETNWWNEAGLVSAGGSLVPGTNTLEVVGDRWAAQAYPAVW